MRRPGIDLVQDGGAQVRARRRALRDLLRHREGARRHRLRLEGGVRPIPGDLARHHRRHVVLELEDVDQDEAPRIGPGFQATGERLSVDAQRVRT